MHIFGRDYEVEPHDHSMPRGFFSDKPIKKKRKNRIFSLSFSKKHKKRKDDKRK